MREVVVNDIHLQLYKGLYLNNKGLYLIYKGLYLKHTKNLYNST